MPSLSFLGRQKAVNYLNNNYFFLATRFNLYNIEGIKCGCTRFINLFILFLVGILGSTFNKKNIILMLISIEIMLLAITFLILVSSISFDDILGQTYAIYIIAIAGAESAIGLGILVAFYRLRGSISIEFK